jgi:uncharacterized membrane protein
MGVHQTKKLKVKSFMRSVWFFLTKKLGLVVGAIVGAISAKHFSPTKEIKYLKGKKK